MVVDENDQKEHTIPFEFVIEASNAIPSKQTDI